MAPGNRRPLFLIVGDGERRTRAQTAGTRARHRRPHAFSGWRRDVATIYSATDVFLLTSRNEGTPVALIEALAAGVPGVSTDVGGVRDVIQSGASGLLAPPETSACSRRSWGRCSHDRGETPRHGRTRTKSGGRPVPIDRLVGDIDALYRDLRA